MILLILTSTSNPKSKTFSYHIHILPSLHVVSRKNAKNRKIISKPRSPLLLFCSSWISIWFIHPNSRSPASFLLAIMLEFPVWRAFYSSAHFTMRIWWEQHFSTEKSRHHYLTGHGKSWSVSSITEENWSTKSQITETFLCVQFDLVVVLFAIVWWVRFIIIDMDSSLLGTQQ